MATRVAAAIRRVPLDILVAQACLAIFVVYGFEARPLTPKRYAAVMVLLGAAALALTPRRPRSPITLSRPLLLLLAWWLLSVTWATTAWSWMVVTERTLPAVLALVAIAAVLPFERAAAGLLTGCYVAMGCALFALVVSPGAAMSNPDGAIGWRGSFPQKNVMALFLAMALPTIMTLERRRSCKVLGLALGVGLLCMSRSVTGALALLAVVGSLAWFWTYRRMRGRAAAVFAGSSVALGAVALLLTVTFMPVVLPLVGKTVTVTGRTRIWKEVWGTIQARPFHGYGVGMWLDVGRSPVAEIHRRLRSRPQHSHNGLLESLVRLGTIGTVLYLAFVLETLVGAYRRFRERPDVNVWTVLVCVVIVTTSVSEPTVFGPWLALLAFAHTASKATAVRQMVPPQRGGDYRAPA